jgi:hypothetical protein
MGVEPRGVRSFGAETKEDMELTAMSRGMDQLAEEAVVSLHETATVEC